MKRDATKDEIDAVVERIKEFGITPVPLPGAERTAIGTFGSTSRAAAEAVESLPGVAEVVPISRPFKLASREVIGEDTVVKIGDVPVGHGHPLAVIAGPCAVESREVTLETARAVRAAGGAARSAVFRSSPRSSPPATSRPWPRSPTACRSVRGTCRTTHCSTPSVSRRSQYS